MFFERIHAVMYLSNGIGCWKTYLNSQNRNEEGNTQKA